MKDRFVAFITNGFFPLWGLFGSGVGYWNIYGVKLNGKFYPTDKIIKALKLLED